MYNSWDSRKSPLMGFNMKQPWCSTLKRGLHNDMTSFITFPSAPIGAKYFNNPNFVNENNPSLLRHPDFYKPVTKLVSSTTQKSPVESSQQKPPEMKKKRKRKRRNRKKNKKTSETVKTDESPLPELTKSFKSISVQPSCEVEVAKNAFRTRVPSVCESEDSFIVFDDRGAEEDKESAIESDEEVVVEESTEVSENEGMSSDCCIPHKKVSIFYNSVAYSIYFSFVKKQFVIFAIDMLTLLPIFLICDYKFAKSSYIAPGMWHIF